MRLSEVEIGVNELKVIAVPGGHEVRRATCGGSGWECRFLRNGWSQRVLRLKLRLGTTHDPIPQTKTQRATYTFESEWEGGRAIRAVGREG